MKKFINEDMNCLSMKKVIGIVVIVLILSTIIPVQPYVEKLSINDSWVYNDGINYYNETVIRNYEYISNDGSISSLSVVNTSRPVNFGYYHYVDNINVKLLVDLTPKTTEIIVTKTGSIPLFSVSSLSGVINFTSPNGSFILNVTDAQQSNIFSGEPARIISTGESESYISNWYISGNGFSVAYETKFLISSDSLPNDINFSATITTLSSELIVINNHNGSNYVITVHGSYSNSTSSIEYSIDGNSYGLVKYPSLLATTGGFASSMVWNSNYKIPLKIEQVEPVEIDTGLSLLTETEIVRYDLVLEREESTTSDVISTSLFISIFAVFVIALVLVGTKKKLKSRISEIVI